MPYFYYSNRNLKYSTRTTAQGLDHASTKPEMLEVEAIHKLHDSAPGDSELRASAWKALAGYDSTSDAFFVFITDFWNSGKLPDESWAIGLLSILPKKGDLSLPGNYYRGKTMLEVDYKIVAQILLARLKVIKESLRTSRSRESMWFLKQPRMLGRFIHHLRTPHQETWT